MKIAIASSGLGHVARGIETWACDTAVALKEVKRETLDVRCKTLDGKRSDLDDAIEVTLFSAALLPPLTSHTSRLTIRVIPCLKRSDSLVKLLTRIMPGFTWRWGLKSGYGLEQFSFWLRLWPILRRGRYDILHVQDPLLAYWCQQFRHCGLVKTKVILGHGTEEPVAFLRKFPYVQHLAPWHLEQARNQCQVQETALWAALPNFVDCEVFRPVRDLAEKQQIRKLLGIPLDAFVVLSVAALKCGHKRVDYVIREFKAQARDDWYLVLAGARTEETEALQSLAAGDSRIRLMPDTARAMMPDLLRAADVMILGSLFEMMPIAVLEALASGLPCLVHQHPVLEWMIGAEENALEVRRETLDEERIAPHVSRLTSHISPLPGGLSLDMSRPGALAQALAGLTPGWIAEHGRQARERALAMFSKETVIRQYVEYYQAIMKDKV